MRKNNEDAVVVIPEGRLYAVIDGMGGLAAGEVAADHAVQALRAAPASPDVPSDRVLLAAFEDARARILRDGAAHPERKEMGAVATAARVDADGLAFTLAHVGDTRAWLVGEDGARQLTVDHVERVASGRPRVCRDLGRPQLPEPWVDVQHVRARRGDLLVLASDGLHDAVPADELERAFVRLWAERTAPDAAAGRLVALALLHGGHDNVSVVVVRLTGSPAGWVRAPLVRVALNGLGAVCVLAAWRFARAPVAPEARDPSLVTVRPVADVHVLEGTVSDGDGDGSPGVRVVDAAEVTLGPDSVEEVPAGSELLVRGTQVWAPEWRVEVGEGAGVAFVRSVVSAEGAFTVRLGEGARLLLHDVRVEAGAFRVDGPPSSTVELAHVSVQADLLEGVAGPTVTRRDDVIPASLGMDATR